MGDVSIELKKLILSKFLKGKTFKTWTWLFILQCLLFKIRISIKECHIMKKKTKTTIIEMNTFFIEPGKFQLCPFYNWYSQFSNSTYFFLQKMRKFPSSLQEISFKNSTFEDSSSFFKKGYEGMVNLRVLYNYFFSNIHSFSLVSKCIRWILDNCFHNIAKCEFCLSQRSCVIENNVQK